MAGGKLLHLADAARVGTGVVVNEEAQISRDGITGAKVERGAGILLDRDIPFKVAVDADRVAALGCELCGIEDWGLAAAADVRRGISVAAFTGHAAVVEWRSGVVVEGAAGRPPQRCSCGSAGRRSRWGWRARLRLCWRDRVSCHSARGACNTRRETQKGNRPSRKDT